MAKEQDKTTEDKSKSISSETDQGKTGLDTTSTIEDNRPEAFTQQKLQDMADKSPLSFQSQNFQELADNTLSTSVDEYTEDQQFINLPVEDDIQQFIASEGRKEVKIGTVLHHVELQMIGTGIQVGVASEWTSINNIIDTLLNAAGETGSEIAGQQGEIKAIFKPVEQAKKTEDLREKAYKAKKKKAWEARQGVSIKNVKAQKEIAKLREAASDARTKWTNASHILIRECKTAIQSAWEQFGDFLPSHLIPASAVFQDRDFTGDEDNYDYHTGESDDPIPIMWYKDPREYPVVTYQGKKYAYTDDLDIGKVSFGLANQNVPDSKSFILQKLAHNESRQGQKAFNEIFNQNNVKVGNTKAPALGEKGGYDGDHVKDLGFGGKDQADNYWPLIAHVNRRAFNGYNSNYIINYLDDNDEGKARAIGGLIGKYFVVKGFYNGPVPDESGTEEAGTD